MGSPVQTALRKVVERQDLTRAESAAAMDAIMSGTESESLIAAFLVALRMKGETVDEITGCAEVMRRNAVQVRSRHATVIDTCGTGGDHSGTFNISTAAAIVAAGAGAKVAKHGNRAVSSQAGSADVLRALGVRIDVTPVEAGRVLDDIGITFLFAPMLHVAMKHAVGVRKELAIRTVFNLLGPLTNPAGVTAQVVGVYATDLTERIASVLGSLGSKRAFVVHGAGGLDEFSLSGATRISEWANGTVRTYEVTPADVGLSSARREDVQGGDADLNAAIIRSVLNGATGPRHDIVALNAAAALVVSGISATLREGVERAKESLQTGAAAQLLSRWIEATQDHS